MFLAFDLDLGNILSFLVGILTGFVLFLAIIMLVITKEKKENKKKKLSSTVNDLSIEKVKELVTNKQEAFLYEVEENDKNYMETTISLSLELLHEIASYYYPDSKYPEYELTIEEAATLVHYVVDQVLLMLDKNKIVKLFNIKKKKISTIMSLVDKTKKTKNNRLVKAAMDSTESINIYKAIVNVVNPIYWGKKTANGILNIVLKKICATAISITGNESNKIYSKNLFKGQENLDEMVEKDMNEITEIYNDED